MLSRTNRIYIMMFLNGGFFVTEIVIGYYVSSLSLIADSFHMLNDLISLAVALWAIRLAKRPNPNQSKYSYGWQRAEILGALLNGVFLLALCFTILMEAIQRFIHMEPMTNPIMVLITGGAGLVANILGLFLFHEHGHGHNHASDDNADVEKEHHHHDDGGHLNMKGIFLHVLGDALGNVGVMAAALFIWLTPYSWRFYMDPAISLIIAIIIFMSALPLVKATSFILLQGVPRSVKLDEVRESLQQIPGVYSVHELHIWQLSDTKFVASLHVLLTEDTYMELSTQMRQTLHRFGVHSATIQPEFLNKNEKHPLQQIPNSTEDILEEDCDMMESQIDGINSDSTTCLLRCVENDSCYEQACCPPSYTQSSLTDPTSGNRPSPSSSID
ncbi:cation efflux family-domain-containing protein [Halteromyces radiatus]|uniref:cation efflux family-domain-containing protein n=1 Tax=Halteromyces radiatus TaxID=101107 RepID=UPI002220DEC5|nr:cation efflux family-domain-containing protein [Halteromyces radiatus]KAI8086480.1 cation efflux family-domain-containing protein [Halteromyces radiatus]